jgi:hypothetical protein
LVLAAGCFAVVSALHVGCLLGADLGTVPVVFVFHPVLLAVMAFTVLRCLSERPDLATLPFCLRAALFCLVGYAVLTGLFVSSALQGGVPKIDDGKYELASHGRVIRHLTSAEYEHCATQELQLFTSVWMAGFGAASILLVHVTRPAKGRGTL